MEGVEGKDGVSRAGDDELCQGQVHQQPVERGAELKCFEDTLYYVQIRIYCITKLSTFVALQKTQIAAPLAKNPSTPVTEAQLPIRYSKAGGGFSTIVSHSVEVMKTNKP